MSKNYKVFIAKRGIVARHLSKRSAETILSMWKYKGFEGKLQEE